MSPTKTFLVFLDKINTSPEVGSFKEVVCDHSLKGERLPDNLVIVAALNPYRIRKKTKQQIDEEENNEANNPRNYTDTLDEQISNLVYRVYPIPPSMKIYIWNFGYLSKLDEQQYISVMVSSAWNGAAFKESIFETLDIDVNTLFTIFTDMIFMSQIF
eukprot:119465_1